MCIRDSRYVLGVYDLLERFLAACPDLLLEGCSGGGGRYDAGMMYYSCLLYTSVNGGRNYNGPKVAKFLVG